ncbi:hypothetical protein QEN19_000044 [Hanseniaspora menglaensis]
MATIKEKFIGGMRQIANQAMILTTNSNKTSIANSKDLRGVTLSSCVSLAVKPYPMLQFNLMKPSFTSNVLHSNQPHRIALHSLPPTEKSTKLAKLFSKGANIQPIINSTWDQIESSKNKLKTLFDELDKKEKLINKEKTKIPEIKHLVTPFEPFTLLQKEDYGFYDNEVPFLTNSNVVFICETIPKLQFRVGDHEIWCVKVIDVLHPLVDKNDDKIDGGLLYCNKDFHSLNKTCI